MRSIKDRLLAKIAKNPDTECWEWTASKIRGYGSIGIDGRSQRAHRVSYEAFCGAIPDTLCVLHRCDNPGCINPDHLFLGTQAQNMSDKVAKGRQQRGTESYLAKLCDDDVRAILASNEPRRACGKRYGISPSIISEIRAGKRWPHISLQTGSKK